MIAAVAAAVVEEIVVIVDLAGNAGVVAVVEGVAVTVVDEGVAAEDDEVRLACVVGVAAACVAFAVAAADLCCLQYQEVMAAGEPYEEVEEVPGWVVCYLDVAEKNEDVFKIYYNEVIRRRF